MQFQGEGSCGVVYKPYEVRRKKNGSDCAYAPRVLTGRPDATCEHEIELLWLPDFVVGIGIPDVVLSAKFTELWARIVVELHGKNCQFYATPT